MTDSGQSDFVDAPDAPDEIGAMKQIVEILEPFDDRSVRRMLEWLVAHELELSGANLDHVIDGAP
jgi:hypothetical protein